MSNILKYVKAHSEALKNKQRQAEEARAASAARLAEWSSTAPSSADTTSTRAKLKIALLQVFLYHRSCVALNFFEDSTIIELMDLLSIDAKKKLRFTNKELKIFVRYEFGMFQDFVKKVVKQCSDIYYGNKFIQLQHDGVTLGARHFDSASIQFVLCTMRHGSDEHEHEAKNVTCCLAFKHTEDKKSDTGCKMIKDVLQEYEIPEEHISCTVQDMAAIATSRAFFKQRADAAVSEMISAEEEMDEGADRWVKAATEGGGDFSDEILACMMHQLDKIMRYVLGELTWKRHGTEFEAGTKLLEAVRELAKELKTMTNAKYLREACRKCGCAYLA